MRTIPTILLLCAIAFTSCKRDFDQDKHSRFSPRMETSSSRAEVSRKPPMSDSYQLKCEKTSMVWGEVENGLKVGVQFHEQFCATWGYGFCFTSEVENTTSNFFRAESVLRNPNAKGSVMLRFWIDGGIEIPIRRIVSSSNSMSEIPGKSKAGGVYNITLSPCHLKPNTTALQVQARFQVLASEATPSDRTGPARPLKKLICKTPRIELKLEWRRLTVPEVNEGQAVFMLNRIARSNNEFRVARILDVDGDGKGEFGLLEELTGASRVRCKQNHPNIDSLYFDTWKKKADAKGRMSFEGGYHFLLYLPGLRKAYCKVGLGSYYKNRDDWKATTRGVNTAEKDFVCYAFPTKPGNYCRRVFAVNAQGKIFFINNAAIRWGGDSIPPPGLAYKQGKDLSSGKATFVEHGDLGGADEPWQEWKD